MDTNFITVDELKLNTAISQNVDVNLLLPFIPVAEMMHIYPILGEALVSELKTQIDNVTLTPNNQILLDQYIVPMSSWYTFYESSTFLIYRSNNRGVTKNFSDTSSPIDRLEVISYKQSVLDKCSFFRERMVDYLSKNRHLYPSYRPEPGATSNVNSTGFFLSF